MFWETCKNSHKFIRRVQYHLKPSFLQGIYGLWKKEEFHQKKKKSWRRSYQKISPGPFKSGVNGIRTLDQCIEMPDI